MELKLNVYNGKEIEKTYTTNNFALMTGTCEDILEVIQIDKLDLDNLDSAPPMEFLGMFMGLFKQFNPIMKQVFDGLTDEEYKRTHMDEVAGVAWQVIMYTLTTLFSVSGKN